MKRALAYLLFCISQLAVAEIKMPDATKLFQAEKLLNSRKLLDGEFRTFYTKKSFQQLREELQNQLGETWVEVKPPEVKLPKNLQKRDNLLRNIIIFGHKDNPKLRVSIALAEASEAQEGESLLLLTLMRNYKFQK